MGPNFWRALKSGKCTSIMKICHVVWSRENFLCLFCSSTQAFTKSKAVFSYFTLLNSQCTQKQTLYFSMHSLWCVATKRQLLRSLFWAHKLIYSKIKSDPLFSYQVLCNNNCVFSVDTWKTTCAPKGVEKNLLWIL